MIINNVTSAQVAYKKSPQKRGETRGRARAEIIKENKWLGRVKGWWGIIKLKNTFILRDALAVTCKAILMKN